MPGTKEIRSKIASVKSTQKITKAMQMVATSKMRRAQDRMKRARPYAEKMRKVIGDVSHANSDFRHPFLISREPKAVGVIVISTDRGLAGGLNANLFKLVLLKMREWQSKNVPTSLSIVGTKGIAFFRRLNTPILGSISGLGDHPHIHDLVGTIKVMLDAYRDGSIDRLYLANANFLNTMTQQPSFVQLLPVDLVATEGLQEHWDYIYEPDAAAILDGLLIRYVESQVYQGAVESLASEMAARMVAMKAATDNAGEVIQELQLIYNKARQAAITTELSEIVGGAAAV
jgi:F-type H+-transporting ATPase subunit gamma